MFVLIDLRLIPVGDFCLPANEIRLEEHVFPCISARIVAFLRAPQSFESQIVLPVDERSLRKFMDEKLLIDDLIDLILRANVNAARRLIENEKIGL